MVQAAEMPPENRSAQRPPLGKAPPLFRIQRAGGYACRLSLALTSVYQTPTLKATGRPNFCTVAKTTFLLGIL